MSAETTPVEAAPEVPTPSDNGKEGTLLEMKPAENKAPSFNPQQQEMLNKTFSFSDLDEGQKEKQKKIYDAARAFAFVIAENTKLGQLQGEAIQMLYRATIAANQSIHFEK